MTFLDTQIQLGYGAPSSHLDLTQDYFQKVSVHISAHLKGGFGRKSLQLLLSNQTISALYISCSLASLRRGRSMWV